MKMSERGLAAHTAVRASPERRRNRLPATALDKMMYQVQPVQDGQCRYVIAFDGRLDGSRLARAVELSLEAAPVLGCRFVPGPWLSRWERRAPGDSAVPFSQVESPHGQLEIDRFLSEPMNPMRGPQAAVRLIRSGRDVLCVKLHHMVTDATGLLDYVRMLGGLYRRHEIDPDHVPKVDPAGNRGLGRVLRGAGPRAVIRGCLRFRYPRSPWGFPRAGPDSGGAFAVRRIDAERVARLKDSGRARRAKLTDMLVAAFYCALIEFLDPPAGSRLPIERTLDLRRYLPCARADAICDLAGAYFPAIRHSPGVGFDGVLAEVQAAEARATAGHPWLGAALFLELLSLVPTVIQTRFARKRLERASSGEACPIFSNLGVIDPGALDFGDAAATDLAIFGPVVFPPHFQIVVYSFLGRLSIMSSFCPSAADPRLVEALLDRFLEALPA